MWTRTPLLLLFSLFSLSPNLLDALSLLSCSLQLTPSMLDSTGRLPAGLSEGNFDFQGEIYNCYEHGGLYTMCMGLFEIVPLASSLLLQNLTGVPYFLRWGVCLPKECNVTAFVEARGLQYISGLVSGGAYYFQPRSAIEVTHDPHPHYSAVSISFITFCSILAAAVIICTLYDWVQRYRSSDDRADEEIVDVTTKANESAHHSMREGEGDGEKESLLGKEESHRHKDDHASLKSSLAIDFLLSFSLLRCFADFTSIKVRDRRTAALDGFRLFAILWVVLGHTYLLMMTTGAVVCVWGGEGFLIFVKMISLKHNSLADRCLHSPPFLLSLFLLSLSSPQA